MRIMPWQIALLLSLGVGYSGFQMGLVGAIPEEKHNRYCQLKAALTR